MSKKFSLISILLTKRQKFILSALVLGGGLLAIQVANIGWRYQAIGALTLLTLILTVWSLRPGLDGVEWLTVLTLPVFFTAGVGLFYFLLPSVWVTRLPVALVYVVGMYVLLLTANIYSVATIRTIQLLRSAHAVGFLLTLVTAFFLYDTVLSFRLDPWFNFLLIGCVSFPLLLSGLWSIKLEERISGRVWLFAGLLALLLAQLALSLSFWPLTVASGSLFLVTGMYIVLGLAQLELSEKLFRPTINEYLAVGVAVVVIMLVTTRWG